MYKSVKCYDLHLWTYKYCFTISSFKLWCRFWMTRLHLRCNSYSVTCCKTKIWNLPDQSWRCVQCSARMHLFRIIPTSTIKLYIYIWRQVFATHELLVVSSQKWLATDLQFVDGTMWWSLNNKRVKRMLPWQLAYGYLYRHKIDMSCLLMCSRTEKLST